MTVGLPPTIKVRSLLADLLGREVTLEPCAPFAPGPSRPATLAVYVDDSLRIHAVIAADLALSAHVGASIGLIPVAGAEDAIEARELPEMMAANLQEVLNVAASLFDEPGAPHVRLYAVHPAGGAMPQDVQARALTLGRREDLQVTVAGYGTGRLSVVLC